MSSNWKKKFWERFAPEEFRHFRYWRRFTIFALMTGLVAVAWRIPPVISGIVAYLIWKIIYRWVT